MATFSAPNSLQNHIRNATCFLRCFWKDLGSILVPFWGRFGPKWWPWGAYFSPLCPLLPQMTAQGSPRYSFGQYLATSGQCWFNFSLFWQLVDAVETCLGVFLFIVFELSFATPSRGGLTPGLQIRRGSSTHSRTPLGVSDPAFHHVLSFRFHCSLCVLSFVLYIRVIKKVMS